VQRPIISGMSSFRTEIKPELESLVCPHCGRGHDLESSLVLTFDSKRSGIVGAVVALIILNGFLTQLTVAQTLIFTLIAAFPLWFVLVRRITCRSCDIIFIEHNQ
jgi:hypothetical protein